jgi:hypothetical protein
VTYGLVPQASIIIRRGKIGKIEAQKLRTTFMKEHLKKLARYFVFAAAVAWASGCVDPPKGYVAKEWSSKMRELGIVPIFPPREDVQVGDIYITSNLQGDSFKDGYVPFGVFAGREKDVPQQVSKMYSARASFPVTPELTAGYMTNYTNNPFALVAQARDTNRDVFLGGDTNRLRLVGFPSFMSVTFNKGDLSAMFPVEGVSVALAGSFQNGDSVTVSVPVAESYAYPAADLLDQLLDNSGNFKGLDHLTTPIAIRVAGNSKDTAYLHVVTEVYYARAVDISFHHSITRAGGLSAKPALPTPAAGAAAGGGASSPVNPAGGTPEERANAAYSALDGRLAETVPGGSLKIVGSGDWGATVRRTYERPIAIGYRGFSFELHSDGTIVHLGPSNTVQPLHGAPPPVKK